MLNFKKKYAISEDDKRDIVFTIHDNLKSGNYKVVKGVFTKSNNVFPGESLEKLVTYEDEELVSYEDDELVTYEKENEKLDEKYSFLFKTLPIFTFLDEEQREEWFGDFMESICEMEDSESSRWCIYLEIVRRILPIIISQIEFKMRSLIKMKLGIGGK